MQRGAREYICFPSLHTHQADGQQEQRGGSECESIARGAIVLGVCGRICFLCLHTQAGRRPGQHPRGGKRTRPCGPAHLALQQASLQCGQHARCGLFSALLTASVCPAFPGCPQARQRRNIPQPAPLRVELQRQWRQPVCRARERREREREREREICTQAGRAANILAGMRSNHSHPQSPVVLRAHPFDSPH
jgi:hypothetical protein